MAGINTSYAYRKFEELCNERKVTPYQVSVGTEGRISTTVLTQWKNGEYNLKLEKLSLIADFFRVPVTEFIGQPMEYFLEDSAEVKVE